VPVLELALQHFGCSSRKLHANYLNAVICEVSESTVL